MMSSDVRPSSVVVHKDAIPPQSFAANGTAHTGWNDASAGSWIHAKINIGAVSSGGIATLTWLQATDSTGTGSKALSNGGFASTAVSTANTVAEVEDHVEQLDVANGFRYVRAVLTITVNTVLGALTLEVGSPRYETGPSPSTT